MDLLEKRLKERALAYDDFLNSGGRDGVIVAEQLRLFLDGRDVSESDLWLEAVERGDVGMVLSLGPATFELIGKRLEGITDEEVRQRLLFSGLTIAKVYRSITTNNKPRM